MADQQVRDDIDGELLRQLREDDLARAWAAIEAEYGQMMLATAHAKLGFVASTTSERSAGPRSATDIVQQVIVELMSRGPELSEAINGTLKLYLKGAVRNQALTAFDKDREVHAEDGSLAEQADELDVGDLVVGEAIVAAALDPLSGDDRYVVEQAVLAARSNAAVGLEIGLTGQRVGQIRKRALRDVARRLGGEQG